jgi:hypothetical protein
MKHDPVDPRIRDLYDQFCHGGLERREFMGRAAAITVGGGLSGLGMAQALLPGSASAQAVSPETISRGATVHVLGAIAEMTALDNGAIKDGVVALVTDQQGAGMAFVYQSSSTAPADGGTIFAPDSGAGRWLRQYSGPFVDAAWWGVKGDWDPIDKTGTDDTEAIRRAIDRAAKIGTVSDESGQGATLCFGPGFYLISGPITFRGGSGNGRTHIQGAGSSSTTFYLADGADSDIFKLEPVSPNPQPTHHHSTLRDFRVFGNRDNQSRKNTKGLKLYGGGSGLVIENVKMDNIAGTGIYIEDVSYITLRNIHMARCDTYCLDINGAGTSAQNIGIDGIEMGDAGKAQLYMHNMPGQGQVSFRNFRIDAYALPSDGFILMDRMNTLPLFIDGLCLQIGGPAMAGTTIAIKMSGNLPRLSLRNVRMVGVEIIFQDDVNSITIPYVSNNPLWNYNVVQHGYAFEAPYAPVYATRFREEGQNGIEIAGRRINFGSGSRTTDISLTRDSPSQLRVANKHSGASQTFKAGRFAVETDIRFDRGGVLDLAGAGAPEGVRTAPPGSTFRRTDGGPGASFYVKESGTGNIGWAAK